MSRRASGTGHSGQADRASLAELSASDCAFRNPRTRKSIGTNRSRQARSLSASSWRSLARVVPQEDWQDL